MLQHLKGYQRSITPIKTTSGHYSRSAWGRDRWLWRERLREKEVLRLWWDFKTPR